eukprot:gb/GECG01013964.1/.p1 GENE.gb/GECG01013964.1/~~gb/GECG01013964.1/.p1  ORF type:complete len:423 (+),score=48.34 gb/GECG01013964.1/:1-1269(+)
MGNACTTIGASTRAESSSTKPSEYLKSDPKSAQGEKALSSEEYEKVHGKPRLKLSWNPGEPIQYPEIPEDTRFLDLSLSSSTDSESKVLKLSYGCSTLAGLASPTEQKANQDTWLVLPKLGGRDDVAAFCVFDGHGPRGDDASCFCREHFEQAITYHQEDFRAAPSKALKKAFPFLHEELARSCKAAPNAMEYSGTTAICVMFERDKLYCANVGDSRALMASFIDPAYCANQEVANPMNEAAETADSNYWKFDDIPSRSAVHKRDSWAFTTLSSDHTPNRADEMERISESEARVLAESYLVAGGDENTMYICRSVGGLIRNGVLFSRSLGDLDAHDHIGIISESEIYRTKLEKGIDRFIVIASDGVWGVLSNAEVAGIVSSFSFNETKEASDTVLQKARNRWRSRFGRRDDMTAIVIGLSSG